MNPSIEAVITHRTVCIKTEGAVAYRKEKMMNPSFIFISVICVIGALPGCFKTQVGSPQANPHAPTHESRQWFTGGGLINLSGAAGEECKGNGVAYATSRNSGWDILIDIGITAVAGVGGTIACEGIENRDDYASCVSLATAMGPLLLNSRTVSYRCNPGAVSGKIPLIPTMASTTEQ